MLKTIGRTVYTWTMSLMTAHACGVLYLVTHSPAYSTACIGTSRIVGAEPLVKQLLRIIGGLETTSPDRYLTVTTQKLVFYFAERETISTSRGRYGILGKDYVSLGDAGLRAFVVWFSYKVDAELHHVQNLMADMHGGGTKSAEAISLTAKWLQEHQQPENVIQMFTTTK